jgi:Holliday junction resolvase Gen1 C-terminal domain
VSVILAVGDPTSKSPPKSPSKRPSSPESSYPDPDDDSDGEGPAFTTKESKWSPDEVDRIWIPEVYVRYAIPVTVREFEERVEARKKSPWKKQITKGHGVGKGKGG